MDHRDKYENTLEKRKRFQIGNHPQESTLRQLILRRTLRRGCSAASGLTEKQIVPARKVPDLRALFYKKEGPCFL